MNKVILWIVLVALLTFTLKQTAQAEQEEPDLYARSALLMDADSGRVLFEKDGYTPYAVASTTKILTAILVLEAEVSEEYATVSANAARQPKVKLYVKEGERYRVKDLLYSLMLESHNDVAVVLAEHVSGSVEQFADLMNAKAEEIGCRNTHFITPNGLDAVDEGGANRASAHDMALITSYALQNEEFRKIIMTSSYTFEDEEGKRRETVSNANRFLTMYDGAIGVKTGFTNQAGYCFVGAVECEDGLLIAVVLGCGWPSNQNWKWKDTRELMDYGRENYEKKKLTAGAYEGKIYVPNGKERWAPIVSEMTECEYLMHPEDSVREVMFLEGEISAPFLQGEVVGEKRIYVNQKEVLRTTIRTVSAGEENRIDDVWKEILFFFCV